MHRVVPTALVLLAILPQACQRDGTTAPQPLRLGAQVAASPPSTKIAFWSSRDGNAEIYVMNADGSGQTRLTNNPAADYGPSWSPDGRRIAFASTRDGYYPDLYTMAPDGSGVTSLTTEDDHLQIGDDQPSWSPDGLRIAFVHKQAHTDNYLVYVMNADGSGQTPLHYGYYNAHPTWSPDGRKIAFASDQYAEVQIVVMNADGSDAVRLTQQNPPSFEPSWSPDGQRIAFGFTNDGIDLINVDGTGQTPLGVIGGNPTWSPDGRQIAFEHDGKIYVMNADGSGVTQLTNGPYDSQPSWGIVSHECTSPPRGTIWCDDFEVDHLASYFEHLSPATFTRAVGVGLGGSYGMRAAYTPGASQTGDLKVAFGRSPDPAYVIPVDAGTTDYRDIYWRAYLRNQFGWTGGGGGAFTRATVLASPSWAQAAVGHVFAPDGDALVLDPVRGTDESGNLMTQGYNDIDHFTWLGNATGATAMFGSGAVGQWYCIEAHMRLNDPGQSNGVLEYWVNGALDAARTGLNFSGSYTAYGINAVFFENYWNATAPHPEERYWDNIVVATQRIGCGATGQ